MSITPNIKLGLFLFVCLFVFLWSPIDLQCCISFRSRIYSKVIQIIYIFQFSSVAQLCPTLFNSIDLQHARLPCLSPTPEACSNLCPSGRWCHPTISSSVVPFSSCPQYFPASGSFSVSQFFASGGQSIGVSASPSVLLMNIQDWSPLGWTGWISLQSKGLSRVFFNTAVQKHPYIHNPFRFLSFMGYYRILSVVSCYTVGPHWSSIFYVAYK